ncbi:cation/H(+) antiporter 24-like [Senna tora]|uniref:Cation/H(+) antiporter 24-like n=1 Tax=Senna tora TaxID=362788 RepID=A0A834WAI5_9FABA|nr:cation/H(+) antiporter 24-like [Senna tora]
MGFMFFLFLSGVKMDTGLVKKTGKRQISTALISIVVPTVASFSVAMCMRKKMDKELAKISSLGGIAGYLGLTSCPALYNILREKNLLSSEVGRTALSIALIGDVLGVIITVVFEAAMQGETGAVHAFWFMVSVLCLTVFVVICVRKWMEWIIEKTPEGQEVSKSYVVSILLGVFVMGFLTDLFGIGIANGPLLLGLAIPDGPPLGTVIVEKTETIIMDFLMPFTFIMVGFYIDVYSLNDVGWSHLAPLFMMCLTSYLTKFLSAWVASLYWRMPLRDGLTLSLMLSLRGQIELLLFVHWMDKMMIKPPGFTVLVLITTTVTATLTPLIHILYDPTKPYMVNKRRTIQHTPPNTDLVIVLSILDTQTVSTLIHLLEVSTPSSTNPISIWALHLVELVGRTNPIFIDHNQQKVPPKYDCPRAVNALTFFQELNGSDSVKLRFFTAVTSKQTMYQDICELALLRKAAFIVVPFRRGDITMNVIRNVASHVLTHAPCSVGILVDRGLHVGGHSFRRSRKKVAMLFLGGADSREALVYADRMAENEGVNLSVARFLSFNQRGESEMEKKMDDGIVTWFWVKNERKESVEYKEVVVQNGEDTIMAIQGMNDGSFDFWIVGRRQGMNPVLLSGLSNWSENEELGLVGDFIASADFSGSASVLVVQQQILRG